jgi:signal transduction histidine kinase
MKSIRQMNIKKGLIWILALIQLAGIGFVDYRLGPDYATSVFYLVPILYVAWFLGRRSALGAAVLAAVFWFAADAIYLSSDETWPTRLAWNSLVRLCVFLIMAFAFGTIKKRNQELGRKNKALEKANVEILRLSRVKAEFTSMVSHEIRSPMAIIKESLACISQGIGQLPLDRLKQYLDMADRNVRRLIDLVNDILDFSKLEEGKTEFHFAPTDLSTLITDTVEFHKVLANTKSLELRLELGSIPKKVVCDADAVTQVLTNVVGNAIKFSDQGVIRICVSEESGFIKVMVVDEGPGIKKSQLHRVFEPFEQIHSPSGKKIKGTGLGMTIAQRIVNQHQGKIWVESDADARRGTTLSFTLPTQLKL